jgi:hypothetical protein
MIEIPLARRRWNNHDWLVEYEFAGPNPNLLWFAVSPCRTKSPVLSVEGIPITGRFLLGSVEGISAIDGA